MIEVSDNGNTVFVNIYYRNRYSERWFCRNCTEVLYIEDWILQWYQFYQFFWISVSIRIHIHLQRRSIELYMWIEWRVFCCYPPSKCGSWFLYQIQFKWNHFWATRSSKNRRNYCIYKESVWSIICDNHQSIISIFQFVEKHIWRVVKHILVIWLLLFK